MTLPNFLIIGAPKSGTTSLYQNLKLHPQIFMPSLKEVNFFHEDRAETEEGLKYYKSLFQDVTDEMAIGEASTSYFFQVKAPERMKAIVPQAKLIAILRRPEERIYSNYWMKRRRGNLGFDAQIGSISSHFSKLTGTPEGGFIYDFYWKSLSHYLEFFDKSQIKVTLFDDLKQDSSSLYRNLCEFLGVDAALLPNSPQKIYNKGGDVKNASVFKVLENMRSTYGPTLLNILPGSISEPLRQSYSKVRESLMTDSTPPMPEDVRDLLMEIHKADLQKLQEFLDRDLSVWLEK